MPLDPRVGRFLAALAAGNPPSMLQASVAARRTQLAELMRLGGAEFGPARVDDLTVPGPAGTLMLRRYTPLSIDDAPTDADDAPLPGLVYFHGGGLVAGTLETHRSIACALAHFGGCRVLSVDYRLAPEHPFPAALEDATAALAHIGAHAHAYGVDPHRLGVCGDSAGATLAAAACQTLAHQGGPALALQLLICPILDHARGSVGSRGEFASGYLVDQATLDHDLLHYASGADPADPRISPLRAADLSGLPPTLIHTAEFDPLRDEGRDYFERLRQCGATVSYTCHPGMIHLFYGLGGVIPYARSAFETMGREIRGALA